MKGVVFNRLLYPCKDAAEESFERQGDGPGPSAPLSPASLHCRRACPLSSPRSKTASDGSFLQSTCWRTYLRAEQRLHELSGTVSMAVLYLPANKCWHMWQNSDLDSPHNLPLGWGTESPLMLPTSTYQNRPRVSPKNAIFVEQSNRPGSVQSIILLLFKAQLQSTSSREPSLVTPRLEILPTNFGYATQGHRAKENTLLNVTPRPIFSGT